MSVYSLDDEFWKEYDRDHESEKDKKARYLQETKETIRSANNYLWDLYKRNKEAN